MARLVGKRWTRLRLWQQFKVRTMARPDHGEVPTVQGHQTGDVRALRQRDERAIDETQTSVAVGQHQFSSAHQVSRHEVINQHLSHHQRLYEGMRCVGAKPCADEFGPEVPVPDTAPLYDRLAAFFGRQPN